MSWYFPQRQPHLVEKMDREDCDPRMLENTYRQFSGINRLISQWNRVYKNELRPLMQEKRTYSLLDIGFGGGDLSVKLAQWAKKDGIRLSITAIDTDQRAYDFVQSYYPGEAVSWKHSSSTDLLSHGRKFDFVISNHVLHHLSDEQILTILGEAKQLSARKIIFSDIERSGLGYLLFSVFARPVFRKSFIVEDGLTSIKRSFTFKELQDLAPSGWSVKRMFPFRLLLTYDQN